VRRNLTVCLQSEDGPRGVGLTCTSHQRYEDLCLLLSAEGDAESAAPESVFDSSNNVCALDAQRRFTSEQLVDQLVL